MAGVVNSELGSDHDYLSNSEQAMLRVHDDDDDDDDDDDVSHTHLICYPHSFYIMSHAHMICYTHSFHMSHT